MLVRKPSGFSNSDNEYYTKKRVNQRHNHNRNPGNIVRNPTYGGKQPSFDLRLIMLRHAERVDQNLGKDWYKEVFGGVPSAPIQSYSHPSLPQRLPYRSNTLLYIFDPPITREGERQSYIKGQQLARVGAIADYCYTSPASRSVLTANAVLKGMNCNHVQMRLEPYLFEPMIWNSPFLLLDKIRPFLSKSDWIQSNYNVDLRYRRMSNLLNPHETVDDYYYRSQDFFDKIVRHHGSRVRRPVTILLVGHASTTEMFTTIALQRPFDAQTLTDQSAKVPYLHAAVIERDATTRIWSLRSALPYL